MRRILLSISLLSQLSSATYVSITVAPRALRILINLSSVENIFPPDDALNVDLPSWFASQV